MGDFSKPVGQISVFNLLGQKVLQSNDYNGKPVDGSFLPVGWYLVRAQTEDGKAYQAKILKGVSAN